MKVEICPMTYRDLDEVCLIEKKTFPSPWTREVFISELEKGSRAIYLVARVSVRVIGYTGLFRVFDKGHITNLAIEYGYRRQGIGSSLVLSLIKRAVKNGINHLTLEVRESNRLARELYKKFGFYEAGFKVDYYPDTDEDAVIMWTDDISSLEYKRLLESIELSLKNKGFVVEEKED